MQIRQCSGVGTVAQQFKLPPAMSMSHWSTNYFRVQLLPFPIWLSANALGKIAEDGPRICASATYMGDSGEAPGFTLGYL